MNNPKKIALVNYHGPFFWPFTDRLASDGFDVYWINSRPMSSAQMRARGVSPDRICDVLEGPRPIATVEQARQVLGDFENDSLPTCKSIIFMDQNLRTA